MFSLRRFNNNDEIKTSSALIKYQKREKLHRGLYDLIRSP